MTKKQPPNKLVEIVIIETKSVDAWSVAKQS